MRHVPCELAAVRHIFSHDQELRMRALPYVDQKNQSINWDSIFNQYFGSGHSAAICWAYSLWKDEGTKDLLNDSFSMDAGLRRTVIQAIAIRWCIPFDGVKVLQVA